MRVACKTVDSLTANLWGATYAVAAVWYDVGSPIYVLGDDGWEPSTMRVGEIGPVEALRATMAVRLPDVHEDVIDQAIDWGRWDRIRLAC